VSDFNAHHPLRESLRINTGGSRIYDLTELLNLTCLNPDAVHTFLAYPARAPSILDLVFASSNLVCNIKIERDLYGSEHFPICVEINSLVSTPFQVKFNLLVLNGYALESGWRNMSGKLLRRPLQ
ncbi:hypothetical protein ALC56_00899, partial [Trachymyrmex septentrionalis]